MTKQPALKPIYWVPSSYDDLVVLPRDVQHTIGVALMMAQAVQFAEGVYVLHVFQKKSKRGIKTPQHVIALIRARLRVAEQEHRKAMGTR